MRRTALGSPVLSAIPAAVDHSRNVLLDLSAVVVATGVCYLVRAAIHSRDPAYRAHRTTRRLVRSDLRFARYWIAAGIVLGALTTTDCPPIAVAIAGLAVTLVIYLHGIANGADTAAAEEDLDLPGGSATVEANDRVRRWTSRAKRAPLLPGTTRFISLWGRKRRLGEISAFLSYTLIVVACTFTSFAAVAVAEILGPAPSRKLSVGPLKRGAPRDSHGRTTPNGPTPRRGPAPTVVRGLPYPTLRTYGQSCPDLPDPLAIGHGIGELFRHDGAVQAGCGGPAHNVGGAEPVWISEGLCGDELRSLGVSSEGRPPVLLYGEAARFALQQSSVGDLLHVESARPDVDLYVTGTTAGTYVFVRAAPTLHRGGRAPTVCADVTDTARPFSVVPPALAELWIKHIRRHGWAWPVIASPSQPVAFDFVDGKTGQVAARGTCVEVTSCVMQEPGESWAFDGAAAVSLADLRPYLPPNAVSSGNP